MEAVVVLVTQAPGSQLGLPGWEPISPASPEGRASPCSRLASGTGQSLSFYPLVQPLGALWEPPSGSFNSEKAATLTEVPGRRAEETGSARRFPLGLRWVSCLFALHAPPSGGQAWRYNGSENSLPLPKSASPGSSAPQRARVCLASPFPAHAPGRRERERHVPGCRPVVCPGLTCVGVRWPSRSAASLLPGVSL